MRFKHRIAVSVCIAAAGFVVAAPVFAGTLYAVSGDGDAGGNVLYSVHLGTAALTPVVALGNGNDGEGIAHHPSGLLYHTSGISDGSEFFETVNPNTAVVGPNLAPGGTYGPDSLNEIRAIEWYGPLGVFLAHAGASLFHVTPGGAFTNVGPSGDHMRGFAVVGTRVYGIDPFSSAAGLFEINPNTGAITNTIPIVLDGQFTSIRGYGLATDPMTGTVYAIVQDPTGVASGRLLATIDVTSGAATSIGDTGRNLAGITFLCVPEPSTLALTAFGLIGMFIAARRRLG